ncbi:MAG: histone deacetylase family protein [Rhodospirillales bacterium]|nr:histone deacetylase family protein [Rhodospirillales bacterium]
MPTLLITHPVFIEHDPGPHHPECPERLKVVLAALETEEFHFLAREEAPHATMEQLSRVHPMSHIEHILSSVPHEGQATIDGDTFLSPYTGEAALRAAGAVCLAIDDVMAGKARNAFCAVRPPGHHAELHQAMGFCFFNNVVVGAYHARAAHNLKRVAVVDWDVHHGNGTQHLMEDDPDFFYASTHQSPLYPGTGWADETGVAGNVVNVPLPPGTDGAGFRAAFSSRILPRLEEFKPELILISAGFDAHVADPIANLKLEAEDFGWATREILAVAGRVCDHRVVSVLEGGYDLAALMVCTTHHVRALLVG